MTTIERTPIFSPEQIVHMHRLRQSLFVHPKNILAAAKEAQIVRPNNSPDAQLLGLKYWNEKKYTHSIPLLWTAFCQNPKKVSFLKYIVQSLHFVCNHQPHPQNTCALHLLSDILLHINPKDQDVFLENICASLKPNAKVVIGMPSLESQVYASKESKEGHVNCQSKNSLKESLMRIFTSVTIFSMNDEVLHTGFDKMSHYLIALCIK